MFLVNVSLIVMLDLGWVILVGFIVGDNTIDILVFLDKIKRNYLANALFIGALPLLIHHPLMVDLKDYLLTTVGLSVVVVLSVYLMNTHWKMISFKAVDKSSLKEIIFLSVLLTIALLMFYLLGLASFVGIIITYVIFSLLKNVFRI